VPLVWLLQGEGDAPRDADEILGLEAVYFPCRLPPPNLLVASVLRFHAPIRKTILPCPSAADVRVPKVQPQHPVILQHPPHLAEHLNHVGDVLLGRFLKAELVRVAVVPQSPIRRGSDATLDCLVA